MEFASEKIEQFLKVFNENQGHIGSFPGCLSLQLLRDKDSRRIFFTYSKWENESALEAYRVSALFRDIWANTKILFSQRAKAWTVEEVM